MTNTTQTPTIYNNDPTVRQAVIRRLTDGALRQAILYNEIGTPTYRDLIAEAKRRGYIR